MWRADCGDVQPFDTLSLTFGSDKARDKVVCSVRRLPLAPPICATAQLTLLPPSQVKSAFVCKPLVVILFTEATVQIISSGIRDPNGQLVQRAALEYLPLLACIRINAQFGYSCVFASSQTREHRAMPHAMSCSRSSSTSTHC